MFFKIKKDCSGIEHFRKTSTGFSDTSAHQPLPTWSEHLPDSTSTSWTLVENNVKTKNHELLNLKFFIRLKTCDSWLCGKPGQLIMW